VYFSRPKLRFNPFPRSVFKHMKILLTMNLPYLPAHGGANKANRSLCEALAQRGHEVSVVAPALGVPSPLSLAQWRELLNAKGLQIDHRSGVYVFQIDGVKVHATSTPSLLRQELLARIKQFEPDVVLISSEDPSQNLLNAAIEVCAERVIYLAH